MYWKRYKMSLPQDARGLEICYGFNSVRGCKCTAVDATTCRDRLTQMTYVHFCSNWDAASNSHCLGPHSRHGNHWENPAFFSTMMYLSVVFGRTKEEKIRYQTRPQLRSRPPCLSTRLEGSLIALLTVQF
jgi:hypothetical protein